MCSERQFSKKNPKALQNVQASIVYFLAVVWRCLYEASNFCQYLDRIISFKKVNVYTSPLDVLISTTNNVDYIFEGQNLVIVDVKCNNLSSNLFGQRTH